jgi:hypothetical protein
MEINRPTGWGARKRWVMGPPGLSAAHRAATRLFLSAGMLCWCSVGRSRALNAGAGYPHFSCRRLGAASATP